MADEWTEANLVPPTMQDRIRVLLDVIEPLVQNELDGRIDTWFFGHYGDPAPYHLRVRILWRDEANANEGQRELSDFLDAQKRNREIDDWYPGSHGYRNQQYPGEADDFGTEMWEAMAREAGLWKFNSRWLPRLRPEIKAAMASVGTVRPFGRRFERLGKTCSARSTKECRSNLAAVKGAMTRSATRRGGRARQLSRRVGAQSCDTLDVTPGC